MSKFRCVIAVAALMAAPIFFGAIGFAQVAAGNGESALAERLLDQGWERTPKARTDSQDWFDAASSEIRSSPSVQWSYALNRMRHRKYREAKPFVDQLAQKRPEDGDVLYAQIWLAVFVREFEQSMALMRQFKQQMDADRNIDPERKLEAYFRLGRLIGYLQGPCGNQVNAQTLENTAAAILQGANSTETQEFAAQRSAVIDQYSTLMSARGEKQQQAMDTLVRKQQVELEQQSTVAADMQKQSADARSNRDLVIGEGQADVDQSKERLDSLTAD